MWQSSWLYLLLSVRSIGPRPRLTPRHPGPGLSDAPQRVGISPMGWAARRADFNRERRGELIMFQARHQPIDDAHRVLHVGVEEHHREASLRGCRQEIGFTDFPAHQLRD